MQLLFVSSESTFTYFEATRAISSATVSLWHFTATKPAFRINNKQATSGDGQAQFGRAMNELNITGSCANTSSAKGRVERAHLTLQDRLEFMADYNRRFAKRPRHDFDVHRPFENNENLEATFTWREQRKVSKKLTLQYDKKLYLLEDNGAAGLINLRHGRPGHHRPPESLKLRVLSLFHDHYSDFGPTLAAEKLRERHNITVSGLKEAHPNAACLCTKSEFTWCIFAGPALSCFYSAWHYPISPKNRKMALSPRHDWLHRGSTLKKDPLRIWFYPQ